MLVLPHIGYRQRGVLEKKSQQYMEQLPGEDPCRQDCRSAMAAED